LDFWPPGAAPGRGSQVVHGLFRHQGALDSAIAPRIWKNIPPTGVVLNDTLVDDL
jgi:hypothetical protein